LKGGGEKGGKVRLYFERDDLKRKNKAAKEEFGRDRGPVVVVA